MLSQAIKRGNVLHEETCLIAFAHWCQCICVKIMIKAYVALAASCLQNNSKKLRQNCLTWPGNFPPGKQLLRRKLWSFLAPALAVLVGGGALLPASRAWRSLQVADACSESHARLQGSRHCKNIKKAYGQFFICFTALLLIQLSTCA